MFECSYSWVDCAYCFISGDYASPDATIKTAFFECVAPVPDSPDYCPCFDVSDFH